MFIAFSLDGYFLLAEAALTKDAPTTEAAPNADACKTLRRLTPGAAFSASAEPKFFI
ncbi:MULTISPECIES: hypothetical protein [Pseudomonas syringae group]|uniref:Uncharacterized protein n=1 Tax=Pseudomonas tremae TaxID=200454 RepID=A0ABV4PCU9_9PSED|nr:MULTISPECIES: hypothetical protein [Pseudomonas syringae group]KPB50028.1 Uncharacterized protein AC511_2434 [Pseudomonas coronafaciens pv. oryzae]MCF5803597.1 hypothetical protein [Pseudomonas tremae]MCF5808083.1 hypothetical protein [Pseudomonas tremae]MCQ3027183.1 hypothetical protein [Pseudomonas tremae]